MKHSPTAAMHAIFHRAYRAHIRRNVHIYFAAPHEGQVELLKRRLPFIETAVLADHSYTGLRKIYALLLKRRRSMSTKHWTYDRNRHLGVIAMGVAVRIQLISQVTKSAKAA